MMTELEVLERDGTLSLHRRRMTPGWLVVWGLVGSMVLPLLSFAFVLVRRVTAAGVLVAVAVAIGVWLARRERRDDTVVALDRRLVLYPPSASRHYRDGSKPGTLVIDDVRYAASEVTEVRLGLLQVALTEANGTPSLHTVESMIALVMGERIVTLPMMTDTATAATLAARIAKAVGRERVVEHMLVVPLKRGARVPERAARGWWTKDVTDDETAQVWAPSAAGESQRQVLKWVLLGLVLFTFAFENVPRTLLSTVFLLVMSGWCCWPIVTAVRDHRVVVGVLEAYRSRARLGALPQAVEPVVEGAS